MAAFADPAVLSLIALAIVVAVSLTSRVNVGVLAVALATIVAVLVAKWKPAELAGAFPADLFLTLLGVSILFGAAQANGTLAAMAERIVWLSAGRSALLPILFFLFSAVFSALGPGAIAASALVAPLAMTTGLRVGAPAFLLALMVGNGANAGNLSPISAGGLIVSAQMAKAGLVGHEWAAFTANFLAHTLVAAGAYMLFGGLTLLRKGREDAAAVTLTKFEPRHWLTLAVIAVWIVCVVFLGYPPGLTAFIAATALILVKLADDGASIRSVPWAVIIMVCGVGVLVSVMDKTGGMDLFTTGLSQITTPQTANGMMAFVTGLISTYSSTSGVVYPAFLPAVSGLVEKLGGGNPLEIALSINVGAALVDVSPLSTIGALALAAVPAGAADTRKLFRSLLIWGFAMAIVGAVFCQLFIGFFAW
jgi:Na+/H+ antiporter NhaD/arsenite permease-like protein